MSWHLDDDRLVAALDGLRRARDGDAMRADGRASPDAGRDAALAAG